MGGRRQFHGMKELFLSDHYDIQRAHTIEDKCLVHSFKNYTKLEDFAAEDYFCRFEYKDATGAFTPDRVAVYCKCEMPYNSDDLIVQCEACKDWQNTALPAMVQRLADFATSDALQFTPRLKGVLSPVLRILGAVKDQHRPIFANAFRCCCQACWQYNVEYPLSSILDSRLLFCCSFFPASLFFFNS